tara:strand:+ start:1229 stop:1774 length:546 start_codon:yes stop_codon:yes gene_type:complete
MAGTLSVQKIQGLATSATPTVVEIASGHTLHQSGTVLQTVSTSNETTYSTTSGTFVQLGETLSITPKFATSKIYVQCYFVARHQGGDYGCGIGLGRGTTNSNLALQKKFTRHASYRSGSDNISQSQMTVAMLDSPNTTSARHYGLMFHIHAGQGGTTYLSPNVGNSDGNDSFYLMLQEIAQ